MKAPVHAPRRAPAQADSPLDLTVAADELLAQARSLRSGRSARTLTPGSAAALKQTLLALTAGQRLQEHSSPGPTTLAGIKGMAVLTTSDRAITLTAGIWSSCPTGPHALEAVSDAVVLVTVAADREGDH